MQQHVTQPMHHAHTGRGAGGVQQQQRARVSLGTCGAASGRRCGPAFNPQQHPSTHGRRMRRRPAMHNIKCDAGEHLASSWIVVVVRLCVLRRCLHACMPHDSKQTRVPYAAPDWSYYKNTWYKWCMWVKHCTHIPMCPAVPSRMSQRGRSFKTAAPGVRRAALCPHPTPQSTLAPPACLRLSPTLLPCLPPLLPYRSLRYGSDCVPVHCGFSLHTFPPQYSFPPTSSSTPRVTLCLAAAEGGTKSVPTSHPS